ncbi:hypothetical protein P3T76_007093 [Phytophthora citrophthora]|uniref:Uncharacterized protein n=1 Tax=Phytophthora citrophthora TaxID=4793 RepID=A0AAD9LMX0_9STRA|nr:hypothetical protein P3T76_007093 [Phytophthora citrophthora]
MGLPIGSVSSAEYVKLSVYSYSFWWLAILAVHSLSCAYNACFAKFYWDFDATFLSYSLENYSIGMPRENFLTIAYVHVILALVHGLYVLHMVVKLIQRCLVSLSQFTRFGSKMTEQHPTSMLNVNEERTGSIVTRSFTRVYMKLAHRRGFFGVNSEYFHSILIIREILETVLQTVQAVRMSKYLPHPRLNTFYVALLVVNCWSSVLLYSRLFSSGEAYRRFALVVCDCALDLMSTVGVTAMIVIGYADTYNIELAGFDYELLMDDNWIAQMLNEAQMILVASWADMAMRVIFSLGLIITTASMQELLQIAPKNRQLKPVGLSDRLAMISPRVVPLVPYKTRKMANPLGLHGKKAALNVQAQKGNKTVTEGLTRFPVGQNLFRGVHLLFGLWGFAVILLHIQAITRSPLLECLPKVYPMAGALPSCFVVHFNCYDLGISGNLEEVAKEWRKFDRRTTVKLYILHCPSFVMPETFQDFIKLQEIEVYNSTIDDWGSDSAMTNTHHPRLVTVSVVRTMMTDNTLPLGFQPTDFPANLFEIFFCETNLQHIPDDIDFKWHVGTSVYVENSQLNAVPLALIRLQPYYVVLGGNPITEVPPNLFEISGLLYLVLSRTNISMLPRIIPYPTNSAPFVDIRDTAVSFFWSWMDPLVKSMLELSPMILASGSTYCNELDRIMNGTSYNFSAPFQADLSILLMNSSEENWEFLHQAVDCSPPDYSTTFRLWESDKKYSME